MELTKRQLLFAQEYLKDHNGTQAAIRCGYAENSANVHSSRLLTNVNIKQYIAEHQAKSSARVSETVKSILDELLNYVNSDITKTVGLTPQQVKDLPIELRRMVASYKHIKTGKMEIIELKFYDKMKALEMVNKHIGFLRLTTSKRPQLLQSYHQHATKWSKSRLM